MGMFDKLAKIKVNMDGKEYMQYLKQKELKRKKNKPNKKQLQGLIILSLSVLGMFLIAFLIHDLTYEPPEESTSSKWYKAAPQLMQLSWSDLGKVMLIIAAPILLVVISLAWIFHGVQFRILG